MAAVNKKNNTNICDELLAEICSATKTANT